MTKASGNTLGPQLRRLRRDKKKSLQTVADDIGVVKTTVHGWELDRREPTVHMLDALLRNLGGRITLGSPDGQELRYNLVGELSQLSELLHGAAQIIKALEYRLTMANNLIGQIIAETGVDDWEEIDFDYKANQYRVRGQGKQTFGERTE